MNDTAPDYGDPAAWDDEWPGDLGAEVAEALRELGWNVTGHHDSGVEIALPPYHETGVWLGGGGRLWTGLLESDSTCPNPIEVTAGPADPGEIAANADPLLKQIAQQAERMAGAIAVGEIEAFLDALAANPQPCDDAYPDGIASVPGPDGAVYLTEDALRALYAKHERAAKGWRLERERAETLEAENAKLHRQLGFEQRKTASVRLMAEQLKRYADWPGITDTATYPEIVESLRVLAAGLVRDLDDGRSSAAVASDIGVFEQLTGAPGDQALPCGHTRRITISGQCGECTVYPPQRPPADMAMPPEEWCCAYDLDIVDPDGWRGRSDPAWDEPITLPDFWSRFIVSTARALTPDQHDRIVADVKAARAATRTPPPACADCGMPETNCACG